MVSKGYQEHESSGCRCEEASDPCLPPVIACMRPCDVAREVAWQWLERSGLAGDCKGWGISADQRSA